MNSKLSRWAVCVLFLIGGLPLYGQQAGHAARNMPPQCSGDPGMPPQIVRVCKPILAGTQIQQLSNPVPHHDDGATYITFDAPGAVLGTYAVGLDVLGTVGGYYNDANFAGHGFLRHRDGTFVTFDDPNAVYGTWVDAMNEVGAVTGFYYDINQQYVGAHGYVRTPGGTFVTFDAPGDVNGTNPNGINLLGAITGNYWDENFVSHGFVRDIFGNITTFDVPGAQSTDPTSINLEGTVVGNYFDANGSHGFQRTWDGTITSFDVPGGKNTAFYTYGGGPIASITILGEIASNYFQPIIGNPFGGNYRGMVRKLNGNYDTFDAATYPPCCIWTYAIAIAPDGTTTGYDNDGYDVFHAFVRTDSGVVTLFDVPGAGSGRYQGSLPMAINVSKLIAGIYRDSSGTTHGFVRIPH